MCSFIPTGDGTNYQLPGTVRRAGNKWREERQAWLSKSFLEWGSYVIIVYTSKHLENWRIVGTQQMFVEGKQE